MTEPDFEDSDNLYFSRETIQEAIDQQIKEIEEAREKDFSVSSESILKTLKEEFKQNLGKEESGGDNEDRLRDLLYQLRETKGRLHFGLRDDCPQTPEEALELVLDDLNDICENLEEDLEQKNAEGDADSA